MCEQVKLSCRHRVWLVREWCAVYVRVGRPCEPKEIDGLLHYWYEPIWIPSPGRPRGYVHHHALMTSIGLTEVVPIANHQVR